MTYQIEWSPTAAIIALAKKRGMPEGEDSPLDYCEADDANETAEAKTFAEAVELAKSKIGEDYFGEVRVEHLVKISSRHMRDRWDADAVWHVSEREANYDEANPDHRPEIDLIDDEEIVTERAK